jgi:HSP20 family molecular chaperone IbpA
MSIARQFLNEFRPLFRMLEEPLSRPPTYLGYPSHSVFDDPLFKPSLLPAVDVTEEGDKYVVEADVPGMKKENIEVRIGDGGRSVTIEGKVVDRRREPQATEASEDSKSIPSSLDVQDSYDLSQARRPQSPRQRMLEIRFHPSDTSCATRRSGVQSGCLVLLTATKLQRNLMTACSRLQSTKWRTRLASSSPWSSAWKSVDLRLYQ